SDYFPLNSLPRARYVQDIEGHPYISLQVPQTVINNHDQYKIQVSWLTVPINGKRYYMPYRMLTKDKFNRNAKEENPVIISIKLDDTLLFNENILKIYLILIKSKINDMILPLKIFPSMESDFNYDTLSPKHLIKHLQLHQSELAFTLLFKKDQDTLLADWNSTVYSNIISGRSNILFISYRTAD
ncbi:unnamed protein product, partial [Didymodactylos carnosus]